MLPYYSWYFLLLAKQSEKKEKGHENSNKDRNVVYHRNTHDGDISRHLEDKALTKLGFNL